MSYLTEQERYKIEILLKENYSICRIANILGRHRNTIANEIKRGKITKLNSDLTTSLVYDAYRGQSVQEENSKNKGRDLNFKDVKLADYLEDKILNSHCSPYAAMVLAARDGYMVNFCLTSLYSYIHKKVFYKLNSKNIKSRKKKDNNKKSTVALNNKLARSISERPAELKERQEFGHWEMDTVVSGRGDHTCLLVLTERKTRFEIIRTLQDKSCNSVCAALDGLEKEYNTSFQHVFKTITCDNGTEFLNSAGIEKSILCDCSRTTLYYCHPYRSSERGSNENANRLIRYWIPKGSHICSYSIEYIQHVQDWLNAYPRKIFQGRSAMDMLRLETV